MKNNPQNRFQSFSYWDDDDDETNQREAILNGTIPTMVVDSAATTNIAKKSDPFEPTNEQSNKVFHTPFGHKAKASRRVKLPSNLRDPAATFEEVPAVKDDANSLLSTAKCTDAGYVQIFDKKGMKMFDAGTTTILVSDSPVATAY